MRDLGLHRIYSFHASHIIAHLLIMNNNPVLYSNTTINLPHDSTNHVTGHVHPGPAPGRHLNSTSRLDEI